MMLDDHVQIYVYAMIICIEFLLMMIGLTCYCMWRVCVIWSRTKVMLIKDNVIKNNTAIDSFESIMFFRGNTAENQDAKIK